MSNRDDVWKARGKLFDDSARFMFEYNPEGKTFRDFHDEYHRLFGEITWKWMDEPDAPDWLESSLTADADHMSQFVPENVAFGIGEDDLMRPEGARDGHFAHDLQEAKGKLAEFETLFGEEFQDHAYTILGRLTYYHPAHREEATIALRDEIARLRRGSPDASP